MNSAIEVRGLCKHYRDFSLRDVSFTVPGGSIMGFIGENGAGKTTTIKSILGLLHTDGGSISVLGRDPVTDRRAIGQDIGVVLDGSFFYEGMRAKDISAVMSRLHSRWDKESFASYCKRFALPMEKPFKEFSKGMRAKLALTTALAHHPKLLVLDEPTAGLDPGERIRFRNLISRLAKGRIILLATHIVSDVEYIAKEILLLRRGTLVMQGTPRELEQSIQGKVWEVSANEADMALMVDTYCVSNIKQQDGSYLLRIVDDGKPLRGARPVPPNLDDLFLHTFFQPSEGQS